MRESLDEMITRWDSDKTSKELKIRAIEKNDLLSLKEMSISIHWWKHEARSRVDHVTEFLNS